MLKDSSARENAQMFNDIAGSYDFLNHLLSLNIDKIWRRKAIKTLKAVTPKKILDIATGTGDLALAALSLKPEKIVGVDVSEGMLAVAMDKIARRSLSSTITFVTAPCENLPFSDSSFDAAMVAFGVRNFEDPEQGLREIFRVLRPGGKLVVLEFSLPRQKWILSLYRWYFHRVLPSIGKLFSRDLAAYRYLPESVEAFPKGNEFVELLNRGGFSSSTYQSLTFGICGMYTGLKNE
ncbi:MAG: bifunctional demethylmenaquinone methyltransferase/2-methoxy-6-polyprenyl-1,4-benzoquinol methylase [Bacteroidetes bacterium GWF2_49_14]|nr:MAG: bifunctional demethylmenaquinone methyltransferase/2-methoxy-6-polyprenyl-1,4-benzoquinol methylase [Bacteroidetes bacterium GWF2_49_14]HBB90246.1 bifunctional demethylmenaquinone methyltransferase/2-methoxy-6-polyprenyl-1,4-benzoquinol methylase UbiE [Bacteroidales bacterium]